MEKRLLLAVFLSMVVVFGFQTVFGSKKATIADVSQDIANKHVVLEPVANDSGLKKDPVSGVATQEKSFKEETFSEKVNGFDLVFSNKGGNIQDIRIQKFDYDSLVNNFANLREFANKAFRYNKISSTQYAMTYDGDGFEVSKNYNFDRPFQIKIDFQVKNVSEATKTISSSTEALNIYPFRMDKNRNKTNEKVGSSDWTLLEYSIKTDNKIIRRDNASKFNEKWNKEEIQKVEWIGFRDRYFATIVQPQTPFLNYQVKAEGERQLSLSGDLPTESIAPGQTKHYGFTVYFGPQNLDFLKQAKPGFERIMVFSNWGWLDAISKAIYWLLGTIHKIVPSWGLCIILISLIVYGAMYPLTLQSLVSMKKMQALQPKMNELKKKYEKTPEKMNQEVMELYRRNGVNPLSGCLPMFLQMPIFVGLYQVLWRSFYFRGQEFLWIKDLSMPDHLFKFPVVLPFLGEYFNILPILMAVIMFFQQKMNLTNSTAADPEQQMQQKMMAYFMPVFLGFIFYNFASGLSVYFVVFYSLSGYSQWSISRNMKAVV